MSKEDDEIKKKIGQMEPIKKSVINACEAGSLPLLKVLIEGGGDVNTVNQQGFSILMIACENGYGDIVKYLIENGADTNLRDNKGRTAIDIALQANQKDIAELLQ